MRSAFQLILHFGEGLQAPLHIAADEVQCNTEFSSCSVAVSAAQASSLGTLDMSQAQSLQLHAVNTGARALSASFGKASTHKGGLCTYRVFEMPDDTLICHAMCLLVQKH